MSVLLRTMTALTFSQQHVSSIYGFVPNSKSPLTTKLNKVVESMY